MPAQLRGCAARCLGGLPGWWAGGPVSGRAARFVGGSTTGPEKKKGQRPFVIMITGNAGKRHQVWAESLGVDGYLNKPFRMERLTESVQKLLTD